MRAEWSGTAPAREPLAQDTFVIWVAFQVFFSPKKSARVGGPWVCQGVPRGARASLTSCLWPLSCWWRPFVELELLMAC